LPSPPDPGAERAAARLEVLDDALGSLRLVEEPPECLRELRKLAPRPPSGRVEIDAPGLLPQAALQRPEQLDQQLDQHIRVRTASERFDVHEDHVAVAVRPEALDLAQERALPDTAPAEDELVVTGGRLLQDPGPGRDEALGGPLIRTGRLNERGHELDHLIVRDRLHGRTVAEGRDVPVSAPSAHRRPSSRGDGIGPQMEPALGPSRALSTCETAKPPLLRRFQRFHLDRGDWI
jgi:hypothetical protein